MNDELTERIDNKDEIQEDIRFTKLSGEEALLCLMLHCILDTKHKML